jgi:hypothetical protein
MNSCAGDGATRVDKKRLAGGVAAGKPARRRAKDP